MGPAAASTGCVPSRGMVPAKGAVLTCAPQLDAAEALCWAAKGVWEEYKKRRVGVAEMRAGIALALKGYWAACTQAGVQPT